MSRLLICEGMGLGTPCYFVAVPHGAMNGETCASKIMPIASLQEAVSFAVTLNRLVPKGRCDVGQVDIDPASCSQAELKLLGRRARSEALRLLVRMSAGHYPERVVSQPCTPIATTQHSIQAEA